MAPDTCVTADGIPLPRVIIDGRHFSRAGLPLPLRAMRLPGVSGTLDFSATLALLHRLRELKSAHTTALILSDAQAEPV
ncbi:MAG TPA: hypothetical protein VND20_09715, partial [Candidatus Binataceae bacterium]|nr:hypothetical protein [Candidatus Binataceae bacterium]